MLMYIMTFVTKNVDRVHFSAGGSALENLCYDRQFTYAGGSHDRGHGKSLIFIGHSFLQLTLFVSHLRQVSGFLRLLRFPQSIELKYC
jgi:hypothetical protein